MSKQDKNSDKTGVQSSAWRYDMPFVNEKLTEKQRKEFVSRGIKRPWSERIANPIYRTIDVERNMCLWNLGNLGRDFFEHYMFLFEWNGEEHYVIMEYVDPNPKEDYIIWKISKFEKESVSSKPFAEDLEEALIKYGLDGSPEQWGDTKIVVDFKGETI
ncbi:MAG: hypothetical protein NC347_05175 [Clostridium sp.]|nr:hypothetical protein [Clostridium sp.]